MVAAVGASEKRYVIFCSHNIILLACYTDNRVRRGQGEGHVRAAGATGAYGGAGPTGMYVTAGATGAYGSAARGGAVRTDRRWWRRQERVKKVSYVLFTQYYFIGLLH